MQEHRYFILGAGVTGLVLAYELLKKGCNVTVIEKDKEVGGLAKTFLWHNIPVDLGPKIYHTPHKEILEYWQREFPGLFYERFHWSKNYKEGRYYDYPISYEFIERLPAELKKKINEEIRHRDKFKLKSAKNYYEYINALVGPTLQEMFFIRYPEKLWGISTKELDANWAPKRIEIRKKVTPFYWGQWCAVGKEGSGSIVNKIYANLKRLKCNVLLNAKVKSLSISDGRISGIIIGSKKINVGPQDIIINTTSFSVISRLLGRKTSLQYRGVILVYLYLNKTSVFPKGTDFIYIDDPKILFHRVSEQNQFVKDPPKTKSIYIFEITYCWGDKKDRKDKNKLIEEVISQFESLGFIKNDFVLDAKVIKLPEVYPLLFSGYKNEFVKAKAHIDRIANIYNVGSLAEYAYSDLQILFSKAIDLAEVLTDSAVRINKIDKTIPRLTFKQEIRIRDKIIAPGSPAFIIAEIGLNHNGDIKIAKRLIDTAIDAGVDAVKLQNYRSKNRIAELGKTSRYAERILGIEETDYEMLEKYELSFRQTKELFNYAKERIIIFSTPFDLQSACDLARLGVDCYKIASFDLTNYHLIKKVAQTQKPLIISTGMASLSEIEEALQAVKSVGNSEVILLHCVSSYPCQPEDMNLNAIDTMKNAFHLPVGLSDHTIGSVISIAAVAKGASIIEKHYTLDRNMEGPDHILSLEPNELKKFVEDIRTVERAMGDGIKQPSPSEFSTIVRFRKTIYAACHIKVGKTIQLSDIVLKGPAYGIYPKFMDIVIGRKALKDIKEGAPITWGSIG